MFDFNQTSSVGCEYGQTGNEKVAKCREDVAGTALS